MSADHSGVPRWEPVPDPGTIDDVLRGLDQVVDWAIRAGSTVGYFAVLYKRITLAIRGAVADGTFSDGALIEQLDVVFARRYFNALNAFFCPGQFEGLTLPWEVAFLGDVHDEGTILQHMMAGLNAHITYDLAPALLLVAPADLAPLKDDFDRVNAVLGSQIPAILAEVEAVSPDLAWLRRGIPRETKLLARVVKKMRESAWMFALYVALNPHKAREKEVNQAAWTGALGAWYLEPPKSIAVLPWLVRVIARRESRDVSRNLIRLMPVTRMPPAKMMEAFL